MGRLFSALVTGGAAGGNVGATPEIVASLYAAQFDGYVVRPLRDPLAGARGHGGSVWTRVAPLLLDDEIVTKVVIAPLTFGPALLTDYAPGGRLHQLARGRISRIQASKLTPDVVVFSLSSGDLEIDLSTAERALRDFSEALKSYGVDAPLALTGLGAASEYADVLDALRDRLVTRLVDRAVYGPQAIRLGADAVTDEGLPTDEGLMEMATAWRDWIADRVTSEETSQAAAG